MSIPDGGFWVFAAEGLRQIVPVIKRWFSSKKQSDLPEIPKNLQDELNLDSFENLDRLPHKERVEFLMKTIETLGKIDDSLPPDEDRLSKVPHLVIGQFVVQCMILKESVRIEGLEQRLQSLEGRIRRDQP